MKIEGITISDNLRNYILGKEKNFDELDELDKEVLRKFAWDLIDVPEKDRKIIEYLESQTDLELESSKNISDTDRTADEPYLYKEGYLVRTFRARNKQYGILEKDGKYYAIITNRFGEYTPYGMDTPRLYEQDIDDTIKNVSSRIIEIPKELGEEEVRKRINSEYNDVKKIDISRFNLDRYILDGYEYWFDRFLISMPYDLRNFVYEVLESWYLDYRENDNESVTTIISYRICEILARRGELSEDFEQKEWFKNLKMSPNEMLISLINKGGKIPKETVQYLADKAKGDEDLLSPSVVEYILKRDDLANDEFESISGMLDTLCEEYSREKEKNKSYYYEEKKKSKVRGFISTIISNHNNLSKEHVDDLLNQIRRIPQEIGLDLEQPILQSGLLNREDITDQDFEILIDSNRPLSDYAYLLHASKLPKKFVLPIFESVEKASLDRINSNPGYQYVKKEEKERIDRLASAILLKRSDLSEEEQMKFFEKLSEDCKAITICCYDDLSVKNCIDDSKRKELQERFKTKLINTIYLEIQIDPGMPWYYSGGLSYISEDKINNVVRNIEAEGFPKDVADRYLKMVILSGNVQSASVYSSRLGNFINSFTGKKIIQDKKTPYSMLGNMLGEGIASGYTALGRRTSNMAELHKFVLKHYFPKEYLKYQYAKTDEEKLKIVQGIAATAYPQENAISEHTISDVGASVGEVTSVAVEEVIGKIAQEQKAQVEIQEQQEDAKGQE